MHSEFQIFLHFVCLPACLPVTKHGSALTVNQQDLNEQMSTVKQALAEFWDRWYYEYLLQLRER